MFKERPLLLLVRPRLIQNLNGTGCMRGGHERGHRLLLSNHVQLAAGLLEARMLVQGQLLLIVLSRTLCRETNLHACLQLIWRQVGSSLGRGRTDVTAKIRFNLVLVILFIVPWRSDDFGAWLLHSNLLNISLCNEVLQAILHHCVTFHVLPGNTLARWVQLHSTLVRRLLVQLGKLSW